MVNRPVVVAAVRLRYVTVLWPEALSAITELTARAPAVRFALLMKTSSRPAPARIVPPVMVDAAVEPDPTRTPPAEIVFVPASVSVRAVVLVKRTELKVESLVAVPLPVTLALPEIGPLALNV